VKIISKMPHVDLVIGTQNIYGLGEYLEKYKGGPGKVITQLSDDYSIPKFLPDQVSVGKSSDSEEPPFRKFVTIMQGCNNYCSYCVVPYTRGREVSRNVSDIVDEVTILVDSGVKEITLLGQNVNSYGKTNAVHPGKPGFNFSALLRKVSSIEGLERLRFTTSNPKDIDDELIGCFGVLDNLCPQFHLPVQAGSDKVLKRMNRKYTLSDYLEKVNKLLEVCPETSITTDIIVGFPGETDEDFEGTMKLLETVRYHGSFSFKYSDRPGTSASKFKDQVDEAVKSERLKRFQTRQDEISLERNQEYIGTVKSVLLEEVLEGSSKGRMDTNHIVHLQGKVDACRGETVQVEIIHASQHSLQGKIIELSS
jgi:tRNA-2-methylthio-N6-dimethylallyladenosine synthase